MNAVSNKRGGIPIDPHLAAVYAAYRAVFDRSPHNGSSEVKELINVRGVDEYADVDIASGPTSSADPPQVLMAAQEPLSHASLEQMGLAQHLGALPGWGCLFFIADHHIYLLHKSLR